MSNITTIYFYLHIVVSRKRIKSIRQKHKKMEVLLGTKHENTVMIRKAEEGDRKDVNQQSTQWEFDGYPASVIRIFVVRWRVVWCVVVTVIVVWVVFKVV